MRSVLTRGGIAIVVLATLWVFTARWASLLIDRMHTVVVAALPPTPIGWNGAFLQFGNGVEGVIGPKGWNGGDLLIGAHVLDLTAPDYQPGAIVTVDAAHRLMVSADGQSVILGVRTGTLTGAEGPIPAYAAEPGDVASVTIEVSWLSWPTPFEVNFMTGRTASWRRHLYYRLVWRKRSGALLEMLWRFEQGYDGVNGWTAPGVEGDPSGLIRVGIHPAPLR